MNISKTQKAFNEIKNFVQNVCSSLDDFEKAKTAISLISFYKDVDEIELVKALNRFFLNY